MNRTNWKFDEENRNSFGITYKNVAFPLLSSMLDNRGNFNKGLGSDSYACSAGRVSPILLRIGGVWE